MAERLALAVIPGAGWSASEVQTIAREAEEAGFDAIFAAEVNNDVMATVQLMGTATRRITVGTWIANIYLRIPVSAPKVPLSSPMLPRDVSFSDSASAIRPSTRPWGSTWGMPRRHCGSTSRRYG